MLNVSALGPTMWPTNSVVGHNERALLCLHEYGGDLVGGYLQNLQAAFRSTGEHRLQG